MIIIHLSFLSQLGRPCELHRADASLRSAARLWNRWPRCGEAIRGWLISERTGAALADNARGNTCGNGARRDAVRDDSTRADDRARAYRHAIQQDGAEAQPCAVLDDDITRAVQRLALTATSS